MGFVSPRLWYLGCLEVLDLLHCPRNSWAEEYVEGLKLASIRGPRSPVLQAL